MEKRTVPKDLAVFGLEVTTFPLGIGEAFESLVKMISESFDRDYYGMSYLKEDGKIVYYAMTTEKQKGEAEKYDCHRYIIEKGQYLSIPFIDWRSKTQKINEVFHLILQDPEADKTKPALEWFKSDEEMLCMIKMKSPGN
jgi:hypothetical protein